jgi:putative aldouronate transport system permease protein
MIKKKIETKEPTSKDDLFVNSISLIIGTLILIAVAYPLIYVISASFSEPTEVIRGSLWLLPKGLTIEGYSLIFDYKPIWLGYRNSIMYSVFGTMFNLLLTLPCAYSLSRYDLKGRKFIMLIFTFTMFFSGGMIPTFLAMKDLGLINNPFSVIFPGAVSVTNLIIARTYFITSVPSELQQAALIDGCSNTRLLLKIVLPLSLPMIAVIALYYLVGHWNGYFNALIYLQDQRYYPLQLFLRNILLLDQMAEMLAGDSEAMQALMRRIQLKESMKYGIVVVSSLPVLILYPFLQKYFVKGVMIGALKG